MKLRPSLIDISCDAHSKPYQLKHKWQHTEIYPEVVHTGNNSKAVNRFPNSTTSC